MRYLHLIFILFFLFLSRLSVAQSAVAVDTDSGKKYVVMPAGPQFAATAFQKFWWGKRWRREWIQPVQFPVFNMDTSRGGLRPLKKGGGFQTKSLRLLSRSGKEYVLRTLDKDLDLIVPKEFKGTVVNDILEDQLSFSHPYGAVAVSRMMASIGALHTNPSIVFVPADQVPEEFKKDFANKLCLLEERPSGQGWENDALTHFATDVVNTEKLYQKLQADNDRQVNQLAYLEIRLFDMIINDWDRHPDQWIWTEHKKNGKTQFLPFARDRDQALSKPDGVVLSYLTLPWMLRKFQNMKPAVHDVIGLNISAASIDKSFLNELDLAQWQSVMEKLQKKLGDSIIDQALHDMPAEAYAISGPGLLKTLAQRRDDMQSFGGKYYRIINKEVLVTGSAKPELFIINKMNRKTTAVTIVKANHITDTIFHRIFKGNTTKEINIYGMGGADRFEFRGRRKNAITLRTIAATGKSRFDDSSSSKGSGQSSRLYTPDTLHKKIEGFIINNGADTSYTHFKPREFKYNWWKIVLAPAFNPDDGFIIKTGLVYRKHAWHKNPYSWEQSLTASMATATGATGLNYKGIFPRAVGKAAIELQADWKGPRYVLNFYGYGNNTQLDDKGNAYFRVRSSGFFLQPSLVQNIGKGKLTTGVNFQSVEIQSTDGKFIADPGNNIDSSVFKEKYFAGSHVSWNAVHSFIKKGQPGNVAYTTEAGYTFNLKESNRHFLQLGAAASFVLPVSQRFSLAHRTGAATNIGSFEFYQANSIGGLDKLRGYWRTRFTGKTSFYQNTELRCDLGNLKGYLLRGKLGCYAFFDDGRVWVPGEKSNRLHTGYGAGIYFIPFNLIPLNFCYGISGEANVFTFRTGFLF